MGFETSAKWTPSREWRVEAGYTWMGMDLSFPPTHPIRDAEAGTRSPENQFHLRSMLNLGPNVEVDAWFRHSGPIPYAGAVLDSYSAADIRLGWAPRHGLRIDFGGKDLLEARHLEFPPDGGYNLGSFIDRSWYTRLTWAF